MNDLDLIRLPNGVRVALDPMPGLATAALGVWQRVGARWEPAELNGVAHLFEHMAFKGAGSRDARQFAEAIENVGGVMNAGTGYERTAYYARVVGEQAPFALDLIADILFAPHWAPDDLEKEKSVVAQERGEAFDAADDRVFELHQAALYPDQPIGRPILGEDETLANVSVATLHAFNDAHMAPERLVVSIAGAFDRAAFLDAVEKRFGALGAKTAQLAAPARAHPGRVSETRKLEQSHLVMSWPSPAAGSEAQFAARLLAEIFGGGMSSRLFQEVRETRGLVYAIDAHVDAFEDDGRLSVYAGCAPKNAREVAVLVRAQLALLADKGPSQAELQRAKTVARAQMLMGLEMPSARAEARVSQVFLRDRLVSFDEIRAKVEAVTAEEIQALAHRALEGPDCIAAIGPAAGHGALAAFEAQS
ncbi:MAG TPA: pitrilysin family protein [Candidatus Binatia bacterium]|nr:pitrilysin family protein [Candidatus Binatia bacterium]